MLPGVNAIGFFNGEFGLAEAGRLLVRSLRSVNYPVSTMLTTVPNHRNNHYFPTENVWQHDTAIISVNATELPDVYRTFGSDPFRNRYVIGQWFWELEEFPQRCHVGYQYVNELWASTKFIQETISKYAPENVKIVHMPLPLLPPEVDKSIKRDVFNIDNDRFMFLFTFDFCSSTARKNPQAVIKAFKQAFIENEGPILVIKSVNEHVFPGQLNDLMAYAEGRKDIISFNEHFEHTKVSALRNLCDCYVSLHRSEGLGLTISEAMCLGKPVIATGYSGNMDFMTKDNSIPISWEYTFAGPNAFPYQADARWAEPNVNEASHAMRYVYFNQSEAKKLGNQAKKDMAEKFSLETCGHRMVEHLNTLQ
jgi:glycosyltransferase involved in cell wall biosynthesis